jgi:uncharacterized membrane protein YheB (UPF0754 family)
MKMILDGDAVERLIGGDTEIEVQVRNSIVQSFTKRYLKSIANSDEFKEIIEREKSVLRGLVIEQVTLAACDVKKDSWGRPEKYTLKPDVEKLIKIRADMKIATLVEDHIRKRLDELIQTLDSIIDERVNRYAGKVIDELVDKKFKKALSMAKDD